MNCSVNVEGGMVEAVTFNNFTVDIDNGDSQTTPLDYRVESRTRPSVDAFRRALDVNLDHMLGVGNHPVARPIAMSIPAVEDYARADGRGIGLDSVTLDINEPIAYHKTINVDRLKPSNVAGALLEAVRRALA